LMAHQGQKVCGHFKKSQIDRPLNLRIDLNNLPKNMSITKMFTIALFIAFGTLLFSCTDNFGKTVGEISIVEPIKNESPENKENFTPLVGQIAALPPDSLNEIQAVEPLKNIETIDSEIQTVSYTHVSGGISMEYITPEKTIDPMTIDSPLVKTPLILDHVVGTMVWDHPPIEDTTLTPKTFTLVENPDIGKTGEDLKSDFIIFPNPTKGEFIIKYDVKKRSDILVEIVDINGVTVQTVVNIQGQHTGKYQVPVNLTNLSNGIYFVNLVCEGELKTQKVILEK